MFNQLLIVEKCNVKYCFALKGRLHYHKYYNIYGDVS